MLWLQVYVHSNNICDFEMWDHIASLLWKSLLLLSPSFHHDQCVNLSWPHPSHSCGKSNYVILWWCKDDYIFICVQIKPVWILVTLSITKNLQSILSCPIFYYMQRNWISLWVKDRCSDPKIWDKVADPSPGENLKYKNNDIMTDWRYFKRFREKWFWGTMFVSQYLVLLLCSFC